MGQNRNLARLQRKAAVKNGSHASNGAPMNPMAALAKLSEVGEMAVTLQESMEKAQALAEELEGSRDILSTALEALEGLQHELTKQRMVFLRLLYSPDILLSAGPGGVAKLLANEERFRAEYDVLQAFVLLAESAKEGT